MRITMIQVVALVAVVVSAHAVSLQAETVYETVIVGADGEEHAAAANGAVQKSVPYQTDFRSALYQRPFGFTWHGYNGARYEHDVYGYRRGLLTPSAAPSHGLLGSIFDSPAHKAAADGTCGCQGQKPMTGVFFDLFNVSRCKAGCHGHCNCGGSAAKDGKPTPARTADGLINDGNDALAQDPILPPTPMIDAQEDTYPTTIEAESNRAQPLAPIYHEPDGVDNSNMPRNDLPKNSLPGQTNSTSSRREGQQRTLAALREYIKVD